jgi:hypothetical protein
MSNRWLMLGALGAALLVAGLSALWFPVHLGQYDRWGMQIGCGRGFSTSVPPPAEAYGADYAGQCGSALLLRRLWAIPAAVAGSIIVMLTAAIWIRSAPDNPAESTRFWEIRGDAT